MAVDPVPAEPVLEALDRAPLVQRLTPEQRADLDRQMEHIRAGRSTPIPHAEVEARLEAALAQAEAIGAKLRARGLDDAIMMEGTPDEVQAYCDSVFGTGPDRIVIFGSTADAAFDVECRAYEAATGERLVLPA
jgi:hypothetical protein